MNFNYNYYVTFFGGKSLNNETFSSVAHRAKAKLEHWEHIYTVTYLPSTDNNHDSRCDALCAMAETLYYYDCVANGMFAQSSSIGSVSSSGVSIDDSPKAQERELLNNLRTYADVYRGVSRCQ